MRINNFETSLREPAVAASRLKDRNELTSES